MLQKSTSKIHVVTLIYPNEVTRIVYVRAASRASAERRALKFNPAATGIHRDTKENT